jgi:hypothetical protein
LLIIFLVWANVHFPYAPPERGPEKEKRRAVRKPEVP